MSARNVGLTEEYLINDYVYYMGEGSWQGFNGAAGNTYGTPYIVCPVHNAQTWEAYQYSAGSSNGMGGTGWGDMTQGGSTIPSDPNMNVTDW